MTGKTPSAVFCWERPSGYMRACWAALNARTPIHVFVQRQGASTGFPADLMEGVPHEWLGGQADMPDAEFADRVASLNAPVIVVSGWRRQAYRRLTHAENLRDKKIVLCVDTPYKNTLRQLVGSVYLRRYVRRMAAVVVPGERAWHYMRYRLGVPEANLRKALYGIDRTAFETAWDRRRVQRAWPRRFLFVGRYSRDKGLDVLLEAYVQYRRALGSPWTLTICGRGDLLDGRKLPAGVEDIGFQSPAAMPAVMAAHGAFVLASRADPWPLVLVEAAAAGLPLVATHACGSSVEVVRSFSNGLCVPTGSAAALRDALVWIHQHRERLPEFGRESQRLASAYGADTWAERWTEILRACGGVEEPS